MEHTLYLVVEDSYFLSSPMPLKLFQKKEEAISFGRTNAIIEEENGLGYHYQLYEQKGDGFLEYLGVITSKGLIK